jgi:hypothetical protein
MIRTLALAALLAAPAALPAAAQEFDCPDDVAADAPPCVPAGLASQDYNVGDQIPDDMPIDRADRDDMPPLDEGEAFAVLKNRILRVDAETRVIKDVLDIVE